MTFPENPEALEAWSVAELVAFFMAAAQPCWLSDDESTIES